MDAPLFVIKHFDVFKQVLPGLYVRMIVPVVYSRVEVSHLTACEVYSTGRE
jgi:hypothetical protein